MARAITRKQPLIGFLQLQKDPTKPASNKAARTTKSSVTRRLQAFTRATLNDIA